MIPLRDANPTRRTPVVTIGIVVACVVAFAWELGLLASGGDAALERVRHGLGRRPGRADRGLGPRRVLSPGDRDARHEPVPARRLAAPRRQPALPVDLRQQHRGPARPRWRSCSSTWRAAWRPRWPRSPWRRPPTIPTIGASGRDRGDARGVHRVLPPGADHVAGVPRLLLPADRRPGGRSSSGSGSCSSSSTGSPRSGWSSDGGVAFFAHIGGFVAGALVARLVLRRSVAARAGRPAPATVG